MGLTHLDAAGRARMVDVGGKPATERVATASGRIVMSPATRDLILSGGLPKGDVVAVARIAGIQAAKQTATLIPLCHPLALNRVDVDIAPDDVVESAGVADGRPDGAVALRVRVTVAARGPTGVEMEALTAVSVALLTIYDMAKGVERGMVLGDIGLESKAGGRHGPWSRRSDADDGAAAGDPAPAAHPATSP
ncbi:MAG: cyclic pyranopterin monophosphate synthase MoaC [Ardenticatenales bacterium]|jgi:cyclic pyranopterin phosphate synthase|nr:cyclic pyranopterin monophosphate synthase MoaC [Ardenticatenales bacterium]